MKKIYILFLFLVLLCSCHSTKFSCKGSDPLFEKMVEKDTVNRTSIIHDSVYVYESEKTLSGSPIKGREGCIVDTLVKNHLEYRFRIMHDSVFVHRVDTVPVVQKVEVVQKVRYIPRWCKWLAGIGLLCLVILLLYLFIHLRKVLIP